jgi:hypothetical protein
MSKDHDGRQARILRKIILGVILILGAYCAGAGRIDAWPGWAYTAFFLATFASSYIILSKVAPDLMVKRVSWGAGVAPWDRPIVLFLAFGPILTSLAAGLDARRHGVAAADWKAGLGYALALAGSGLTQFAMASNRFYSSVVRIQKERGHRVVESGPYRLVRHPKPGEHSAQHRSSFHARLGLGLDSGGRLHLPVPGAHGARRSHAAPTVAQIRRLRRTDARPPHPLDLVTVAPHSSGFTFRACRENSQ